MKRTLMVLAVLVAACTRDTSISAPEELDFSAPLASIGVDSVTGALIETSQDDYAPGEVVHLVGRGWAAGEAVRLHMTEDPETHEDVDQDVQADSAGGFELHFYDVQEHDLGVTFTLTATGLTSGSSATAVFTDGNVGMRSGPSGIPSFIGTVVKYPQSNVCDPNSSGQTTVTLAVTLSSGPGTGLNALPQVQTGAFTAPTSIPGYTFSGWTVPSGVTVVGGSTASPSGLCVRVASNSTSGVVIANYVPAQQSQTIAFGPLSDKTYGDAPISVSATASSGLAVSFSSLTSTTCAVDGATVSILGAGTCTIRASQAGDASYYAAPNVDRSFEVTRAAVTVTAGSGSGSYHGLPQSPSPCMVTGSYTSGLSCLNSPATVGPNVGTTAIIPVVSGSGLANFEITPVAGSYTVFKAQVTAQAGDGSAIYDGGNHHPSACALTGDYVGDLSCTNDPADVGPNAGTTAIRPSVSGTGLDNFDITEIDGSFVIHRAEAVIVVTGYTGYYDGQAHRASGSAMGVLGEDLSALLDLGVGVTNVPGGTANWTFNTPDLNSNYNPASGDVAITINRAPVTATAGSGAATYNGAPHNPSACVVTGLYTGDLTCANDPSTVGPDVVTTAINPQVNGTGLGNFAITPVAGSFTIEPAPVTATAGSGSATYDGAPHTPSACVLTGDYLGNLTCSNEPATVGPDAGDWPVGPVVSGTGLTNFEITEVSGSFVINRANATISVSGYTGYYDGSAHRATGSATGVLGEDLTSLLDFGASFTNVPGGTAYWTFNGGDANRNYHPGSGSVAVTILAWTLRGFYQPVDMNGVFNVVKGGSTVPLKFEVFVGTTERTDVAAVKGFVQTRITCDASVPTDEIEITTTGGTSLRYDGVAGQFIQNWQTPKLPGQCYRVTMTTQDNSTLVALFRLK